MIQIDDKTVGSIYLGLVSIEAVYLGAQLVWQAVASCFGSGYWIRNKVWSNKDGWRNN